MKYNSKLTPAFKDKSFCYFTFSLKNKNAILYETNMTGHELVGKDYYLKRTGYYTYLISYTLNGSAKFIYNKKEHIISKGDLVFIDCSNDHEFYPIDENWDGTITKTEFDKSKVKSIESEFKKPDGVQLSLFD